MALTPNTNCYLCSVPIDATYKNQLTWDNRTAQYNYFNSTVQHTATDFTYQRHDNVIRWPNHIDNLWNVNYVMYQNTNFTNRWFYAFILRMEYVDDGCTNIYISTDVWQTWYFDITVGNCFVEREHDADDNLWGNLTPEGLEVGEYTQVGTTYEYDINDMSIVMCVSRNANYGGAGGELLQRVYTGCKYLFYTADSTGVASINSDIQNYNQLGQLNAIVQIFMLPTRFRTMTDATIDVSLGNALSGNFVPKNKKLYSYPYSYITLSNNEGIVVPFYKENLTATTYPDFQFYFAVRFALSGQSSATCYPVSYRGSLDNMDEGVTKVKFPQCSWTGDVYANWLAQNINQAQTQLDIYEKRGWRNLGTGAVKSIAKVFSRNPFSGVTSAVNTLESNLNLVDSAQLFLAKIDDHAVVPPQAQGNTNSDSALVTWRRMKWTIRHYSMKREFLQKVDNYFTMYGYSVGDVKVPNGFSTGSRRPYFNFIKTDETNVTGAIPYEDMIAIKNSLQVGITFWHNPQYVGDYSVDNSPRGA